VRGAYLGLTSLTIDGSLSALNLPVKQGALVQTVQKNTAAAKAGIRGGSVTSNTENGQIAVGGDIIVSIDGKAVTSSEDLANDISARKPGDKLTLELRRATGNGNYESKTVTVTLGSRPNSVPNPNTPEG
jgi:serine protease Do